MKTTYVIAPFKSTQYLIRCINSILRQTVENNEIIIAENSFDKSDEIGEFLGTVKGLKLISDQPESEEDKIKEAVSLADDESLISFISIDTVVAPIASQTVSKINADIIAVSHGIKNNKTYTVTLMNESPVVDSGKADIQSLFIKKKLMSQLCLDVLTEKMPFELCVDKLILDGVPMAVSGELCFYLTSERLRRKTNEAVCCLHNKSEIVEIVTKGLKANTKEGLFLFDKYLSKLYRIMISDKYDLSEKSDIFDFIKELGELVKENGPARRIYELYLGDSIESVSTMGTETYLFYADRLMTVADKVLAKAQLEQIVVSALAPIKKTLISLDDIKVAQKEQLNKASSLEEYAGALEDAEKNLEKAEKNLGKEVKGLESAEKSLEKEVKNLRQEVKSLKKDIELLTKNMDSVITTVSNASKPLALMNTRKQVPALYAQGKLGLRVLIKSFKAWLKHKLSRKKK